MPERISGPGREPERNLSGVYGEEAPAQFNVPGLFGSEQGEVPGSGKGYAGLDDKG